VSGAEARKRAEGRVLYSPFASSLLVLTYFLRALFLAEDWESERERERERDAAAVTEITSQPRKCFSLAVRRTCELEATTGQTVKLAKRSETAGAVPRIVLHRRKSEGTSS